jgi:N6-adenosine-specific RNA methylase IME4
MSQILMSFAPAGRYRAILMDPPWPESGGGGRGAQEHYDIHGIERILTIIRTARMPDGTMAFRPDVEAGCHLLMWATETNDEAALWLIRALGFRKVAGAVWVKTKEESHDGDGVPAIGLGQYVRYAHERLLIAVCGPAGPPAPEHRPSSVTLEPRLKLPGTNLPWHSRKPDMAYEYAERIAQPGPRLEMFARMGTRPGWDYWGNESRA